VTALASYQIVADTRPVRGTAADEALVATAAWASFTTARRIGSWLHQPTWFAVV
jgi:hypothetical protein